jgi:HlyD family secretion protein
MKNSIDAQIGSIDSRLGNTYTTAMKEYYLSQIEAAELRIKHLGKQIEECTVKAPVSGTITDISVDKSNVTGIDSPVAVVSTGFDCLVEVYVPTAEIGSVSVGDLVDLELKSNADAVYCGTVVEIDDRAVVTVSSLGIEKRKVKVTIEPLPEHAEYFKSGYDLNVSFTTYFAEDRLTVPRTAVVWLDGGRDTLDTGAGQAAVWVISGADGQVSLRAIEIERELNVEYIVKSGISAGEMVVQDATAPGLAEGARFTGTFEPIKAEDYVR